MLTLGRYCMVLLGAILLSGGAMAETNTGSGPSTVAACKNRCDDKYVNHGDQSNPGERARYARCLSHCSRIYPH